MRCASLPRPPPLAPVDAWTQVEANSTMFQTRMMQLKVRVKAIVGALKGAGLPPESIVNFLVTLLEDDNYFPQVPVVGPFPSPP